MMLEKKVAVIYGAGGAIGSAVARAFARQGAKLFLTGRHRAPVEAIAEEVDSAETAVVDALDEPAVDRHLQSVIDKAGHVDVSWPRSRHAPRSGRRTCGPSWLTCAAPGSSAGGALPRS
jgi:NADP-dependent 3-hydroxy acid dehydrogenase YdfG